MNEHRPSTAPLEAVPNLAAGGDDRIVNSAARRIAASGCELLDTHSDSDHGRTVLTVVGAPQQLGDAMVGVAHEVVEAIDMRAYNGIHPCIGALDVLPIAYLSESDRELAADEALGLANRISSELELPVFLYGELASGPDRAERAFFRDGGLAALTARMEAGELAADFGPSRPHPSAGATLVTARPPLVAFNVELGGATLEIAKQIAAELRESGGGLPGVRAIGLELPERGIVQVSTNIHDPLRVPLREVVAAVQAGARKREADVSGAELVGLAPAAALDGLEPGLLRDFDPHKHVLEARIGTHGRV